MKVLLAGSSGLVGIALILALKKQGHEVTRLVRKKTSEENTFFWDPAQGEIDEKALVGQDAVINMCGDNVASGLWTTKKRKRILDSRTQTTGLLVTKMKEMTSPPKIFINASAMGFYGDQGETLLTEDYPSGGGFLAEVCQKWEEAADEIKGSSVRLVKLRIGVVLDLEGGALQKMLPAFKCGVGGRLGSGKQYMSWISLADVISITLFALENEGVSGALNTVAPNPVTNSEFTQILGKVLGRPTVLPAPAFALKLVLGDMAKEMLLASTRVSPQKLIDAGYTFQDENLEDALRNILDVQKK